MLAMFCHIYTIDFFFLFKEFVIGLDVGTTTVRSFLYNKKGD